MISLETWRQQLKHDLATFAPLAKEDRNLDLIYGITAAAVLWQVREAPYNDAQKAVLRAACGEERHLPHLLKALGGWDAFTPLEAARVLSKRQSKDESLRAALTAVLATFIEVLFAEKVVQQQHIDIGGTVSGGNIVIGGYQIVAGDLIVQYIRPKTARICPTPEPEPEKFGGREARLSEIMARIKAGEDTAITAVQGLGGIGKTTLARVLASRLYADKTFRAVLWADVSRNPNAVNILSDWVVRCADSTFDVSAFKGDENQIALAARDHLESVIAEQCQQCDPPRVLVVLDDVWDNGREAVRLIRRACPEHTTLLLTTRSENVAIDLGATVEALAYLTPDEAAAMLKTYLPGYAQETLKPLGKALGGHALALELAARRVQKERRPGEDDAAKLRRIVAEYEAGIPAGSPFAQLKLEQGEQKEDNLTRSLYHSYELLDPDAQRRFRELGVLAYDAPFRADILAAVWEVTLDTAYDAADQLRLLSLLDVDGEGYRQHPLLRAYARALLDETQKLNDTASRHFNYFIKLHSKKLPSTGKYAPVTTDFENLKLAYEWGWNNGYRNIVLRSFDSFITRDIDEFDDLADATPVSIILLSVGRNLAEAKAYEYALSLYEKSIIMLQMIDNQYQIAVTRHAMSTTLRLLHRLDEAEHQARISLETMNSFGNVQQIATVKKELAMVLNLKGSRSTALKLLREAIQGHHESSDMRGELIARIYKGIIQCHLPNQEEAGVYELLQAQLLFDRLQTTKISDLSMPEVIQKAKAAVGEERFKKLWQRAAQKHKH